MRRRGWLYIFAMLVCATFVPTIARAQLVPAALGANLEKVRDWARTSSFVDVVKQSRGFYRAGTNLSELATLDANGWPTEDFDVILMTDIDTQLGLAGTYKIRGYCNVMPTMQIVGGVSSIINHNRDPDTGLVTADLVLAPGADAMILKFSSTAGGIRDLKVIRPGYNAETPPMFSSPFLDHIGRFPIIRFMDWTQTNGSIVREWSDDARLYTPSYAGDTGVPWEACIELCNTLNVDAWINVPHMASDDYVVKLATLVRDRLETGRHVYVEYSNEVWNPLFSQHWYNKHMAVEGGPGGIYNFDDINSEAAFAARRVAHRTKQIADIFSQVMGPGSLNNRVRVILAGQQSEPAVLFWGLEFLEHFYGPPKNSLYALAGAPYIVLGSTNDDPNMTVEDVIAAFQAAVVTLPEDEKYEENAAIARWYDLRFVAYEGGPDTRGPNGLDAKRLAMYDPRMRQICRDHMRYWFEWGFSSFCWYTGGATSWSAVSGAWGLTEDMTIQNTPKILAMGDVRDLEPFAVTQGNPVPGSIDARRFAGRRAGWDLSVPPYIHDVSPPQSFDYLLNAGWEGTYKLQLTMGASGDNLPIGVWVNGAFLQNVVAPNTGSFDVFAPTSIVNVPLTIGTNVVRLQILEREAYSISQLRFICPADLDNDGSIVNGLQPDGGVDINDLLAFLFLFESGDARADLDGDGALPPNPDGGVDINDLLFFLARFETGC